MPHSDVDLVRRFAASYRDPSLAVLEGFHPAVHAIRFGAELLLTVTSDRDRLLGLAERLAPDAMPAIDHDLRVVDPPFFAKLSPRSLSSPLLAVAPRPDVDMGRALAARDKPIIFLHRPRNPGNVGAVIRVAAAADVAGVIVSGEVDPWSPVVIRSAAGLQFALPVESGDLPSSPGRALVVVDPAGEPLGSSTLDPGSILVVGGERYGIPDAIRAMADRSVAIPMRDGVSSLNLATALSAVLFSWRSGTAARNGDPPW